MLHAPCPIIPNMEDVPGVRLAPVQLSSHDCWCWAGALQLPRNGHGSSGDVGPIRPVPLHIP